ncbi:MAG: chromosome segregation protein SMC [Lachnospiraceae bacterium]|nr:chromosome segregation protein SMC [Lachnospiraceae bacterium]
MYLKTIEVQGFKSFANKITFKFHNGITGIVGPNGSGKSNVADAVRWVLGEQRIKQLRGASMQDVIFSGTEMRKPLSYAYVAITLDNSDHQLAIDYDEVTVSRRIYRSGESEYCINGNVCRLKDVNELFYDTGIGKEGYSIIGQGQIDKILSGKPEERRELFDEAAGIVKFKKRKALTQKKLEDEKQNLIRVKDILGELEKQVGPLEKQAEKAKVYLKKKEELKTLDVNVFLLQNEYVATQLEAVESNYEIASKQKEESTREYEKIKEEYTQVEGQLEMLEEQLEKDRNTLTSTSVLRGKLEGDINVLKEQIHSVEGNLAHLQTRLETVGEDIRQKSVEEEKILEGKKEIDVSFLEAEATKKDAKDTLNAIQNEIEDLNNKIETGKNTIIQALNDRATIKSKMGRLDTMLEQIGIRKAELTSKLMHVKSDEEKQLLIIRDLEKEFEDISANIQALNQKQKESDKKLIGFKSDLTNLDENLRKERERYHIEKSKLDALSNLTERYEGYGGSVKKVMEQKDRHKGIIGVVADIIQVDAKYETAIETALGGNIQNIVTKDEDTAKDMIALLKKEKAGRATFLPLTSIGNVQPFKTPEVLEEKGVLGLADSLVSTKKEYADVAKAMLGRIVVVDTVDHAVTIARKYSYGIRMVTLEGELLVPGGAISGGAFKNNSNLLGRRREMEELSKSVAASEKKIQDIEKQIEDTKTARTALRQELETIKSELQETFIRQNTARLNVAAAREKQSEAEAGADSLKQEAQEIELQIREIETNKAQIQEDLKDSETLEKETEKSIAEYQKTLEEKRLEETNQSNVVSEKEVELEKIVQRRGFEQQNLDRVQGEMHRLQLELTEIKGKMVQSEEESATKQSSIEELQKNMQESLESQKEAKTRLEEMTKNRETLQKKQKEFFQKREEMSAQIQNLEREVYRLETQREKHRETIQTQIDYMWNEYEITLHDAKGLRDESMQDLTVLKREAASVKDSIRRLGDVNVNAIEDFKVLMERYTHMKTQHDDLVEAEAALVKIIEELDAAMRKQFTDKFTEISKEFDKVFKELFGGGKGTLELLEDEDILEAGIRIIAQPPGKKLQNMMQLSGGEKALTAIALLFAIQNLKPSPFCLLDEIEAALDESNVARYASYLHKLTKHTQSIVITHRRGTMERSDRLYGITMQEKGVSTLVSVDLIQDQLDQEEKQTTGKNKK